MAEVSPYLNSNPIDRAFALGQTKGNYRKSREEIVEVFIKVDGRIVWTSGGRSRDSLRSLDQFVHLHRRPREKIKMMLHLTRYSKGFPYQAMFSLPFTFPPPNKAGVVSFRVLGSMVQSSSGMNKAAAWSARTAKTSRSSVPRVKSSTLRPTPEVITRSHLRTFESLVLPSTYTLQHTVQPRTVYFRSWTGNRTPGWGKKTKTNYVDNNHTVRIVDVQENRHSWYQVQQTTGAFHLLITPYAEVYAIPDSPLTHSAQADFQAIKKLIAKAQVGIQANLAQNIAQVSQLSSLVVGNATAILKSLRALKQGNIPAAIRALKAAQRPGMNYPGSPRRWTGSTGSPSVKKSLASNWLQLQYGWKPLLADIEGMFQVMVNLMGENDFVQRVTATSSHVQQATLDYPPASTDFPSGKTYFTARTSVKYVVRWRMDNPLLALFAQTGFTNPVNLFWEILPFSFVGDWILPIGSYLEALNAWDGATFLGGSKTQFTKEQMDSTESFAGAHPSNPSITVNYNSAYRREEVKLARTALSAFPSQSIPTLRNGIEAINTGNRAANAIALLVGAFKR